MGNVHKLLAGIGLAVARAVPRRSVALGPAPVHRWARLSRTAPLHAMVVTLAVTAAGCGGRSSPSIASIGTSTSATTAASKTSSGPALTPEKETAIDVAYAACMTRHGVQARAIHGGGVGFIVRPGSPRPGSPIYVAAQRACKRLLPKGGLPAPAQTQQQAQIAKLRELATCMRSHGEPNFPDPSANGNLLLPPSIDPKASQFQTAQKDCAKYFPAPPPNASPGG